MHNIAMRYIFERSNVSVAEMRILEDGLCAWYKRTDLTQSDKWELKRIVCALNAEEAGHFYRAKQLLIQHKLHYRQLFKVGLPYLPKYDK